MTVLSGVAPCISMARRSAKGAGFMAWSTTSHPSSSAVARTWPEWKLLETRQSVRPAERASASHAVTSAGTLLVSLGTQVLSRSRSTSETPSPTSQSTLTWGRDAT